MSFIGNSPKAVRTRYQPQAADPTDPAEGDFFYSDGTARAEGLWVYKNATWVFVQSTTSGGINYDLNPNADSATEGYATYADAPGVAPVDGTGGSPNITFAVTTTAGELLRGNTTFEMAKDAVDRQGQGISYDMVFDRRDYVQSNAVYVSFDYGTSVNYASGDMIVYVYDITNSTLIGIVQNGNDGDILSANDTSTFTGVFYTVAGASQYRLIWHIATTNANAYDLFLDNIVVTPQATTPGAIVTPWESYTLNITAVTSNPTKGTVAVDKARWRRVGDSMEIRYDYRQTVGGSAGTGIYLFAIPSGYTIDTDNIEVTSGAVQGIVGAATTVSTTEGILLGSVRAYDSTHLSLIVGDETSSPNSVSSTFVDLADATATYGFEATIPISGWPASAALSTNEVLFSTLRVVSRLTTAGTHTSTGNWQNVGGTWTDDEDNLNAFSNGTFTAPYNGTFLFVGTVGFATTDVDGQRGARWDGPTTDIEGNFINSSSATGTRIISSGGMYLTKGQTAIIQGYQDSGSNLAYLNGTERVTILGFPDFSIFSVFGDRINVGARAYNSSTSISGTLATIVWTTEEYDSNGALASGVYTCPYAGKYQVNTALAVTGTFVLNNTTVIEIQKNGTAVSSQVHYIAAAVTNEHVQLSDIINCSAGDTIRIQASNSGTTPTIVSSNTRNFLSISYMGQ